MHSIFRKIEKTRAEKTHQTQCTVIYAHTSTHGRNTYFFTFLFSATSSHRKRTLKTVIK